MSVGILAVLQTAATIVEFIKDLKDAPKELKGTLDEIEALRNVLHQILELHNKSSDGQSTTQILLNSRSPLKECLLQLEKLNKKLIPVNRLDKTRKAMAWRLHKGEIKSILTKIERQKSLLSVSLHVETQYAPDQRSIHRIVKG